MSVTDVLFTLTILSANNFYILKFLLLIELAFTRCRLSIYCSGLITVKTGDGGGSATRQYPPVHIDVDLICNCLLVKNF